MARAKDRGNGKLEEALAILIQNQAAFLTRMADMDNRFARIESLLIEHGGILAEQGRILADHSRILVDHTHILKALPDTIRDKIGFKSP